MLLNINIVDLFSELFDWRCVSSNVDQVKIKKPLLRYSTMLRKLNLFLTMLAVIITISPLAQARGRDGHRHGKNTKAKQRQIKKGKGKVSCILN